MIVCGGECGAKVAARIPRLKDVVVIGSRLDLTAAPDDVEAFVVNVGSDTGAHRDHKRAYRQLEKGENKNVINAVLNAIEKGGRPPILVYGLCGATGLSIARRITDEVPAVHVVVLPHPSERDAARAVGKFEFVTSAKKANSSVFRAVTPAACMDDKALDTAASIAEASLKEFRTFGVLVNAARNDMHSIDDEEASLSDIEAYVKTAASGHGGRVGAVAREREDRTGLAKEVRREAGERAKDRCMKFNDDVLDLL